MEKFTRLEGVAVPLMRQNVDTDVVIRIDRLVGLPKSELGRYCFESIRYRPDGSENPDFVGNQTPCARRADPAGRRQFRLRLQPRGRGVGADAAWASGR